MTPRYTRVHLTAMGYELGPQIVHGDEEDAELRRRGEELRGEERREEQGAGDSLHDRAG